MMGPEVHSNSEAPGSIREFMELNLQELYIHGVVA
jgi:hypothetical protein